MPSCFLFKPKNAVYTRLAHCIHLRHKSLQKVWYVPSNRVFPSICVASRNLCCKLTCIYVFQARPDSSRDRDLRSVCCHSCQLQILPVKQANKIAKAQTLMAAPSSLDPALNQPPYIQEQGRRLSEAVVKTHTRLTSQECNQSATNANEVGTNRDHMRAYLGSYLLTPD